MKQLYSKLFVILSLLNLMSVHLFSTTSNQGISLVSGGKHLAVVNSAVTMIDPSQAQDNSNIWFLVKGDLVASQLVNKNKVVIASYSNPGKYLQITCEKNEQLNEVRYNLVLGDASNATVFALGYSPTLATKDSANPIYNGYTVRLRADVNGCFGGVAEGVAYISADAAGGLAYILSGCNAYYGPYLSFSGGLTILESPNVKTATITGDVPAALTATYLISVNQDISLEFSNGKRLAVVNGALTLVDKGQITDKSDVWRFIKDSGPNELHSDDVVYLASVSNPGKYLKISYDFSQPLIRSFNLTLGDKNQDAQFILHAFTRTTTTATPTAIDTSLSVCLKTNFYTFDSQIVGYDAAGKPIPIGGTQKTLTIASAALAIADNVTPYELSVLGKKYVYLGTGYDYVMQDVNYAMRCSAFLKDSGGAAVLKIIKR